MSKRYLLLALLILLLGFPTQALAQTDIQISGNDYRYTFGSEITFQATLNSKVPIKEVLLVLQPEGSSTTEVSQGTLYENGLVISKYDLGANPIRAYSRVDYWYQVTLTNGETLTVGRSSFDYADNRYTWQVLNNDPFEIHWYHGDAAFGRDVLNVAQAGLKQIQSYLPVAPKGTVKIYVYDSASEVQKALQLSGQSWIAGHADPDLGVILVSLPDGPEQHLEMERQVPHEIMHVMLYQTYPEIYSKLPVWLNEGLASISELYPSPDYRVLLETAFQKGSLLPISSLCQSFPKDANGALLSYSEAAAFTRFLYNQYGTPGLVAMIDQSGEGTDCERSVQLAFGTDLARLEGQWRGESFAENTWQSALDKMTPWALLLALVLVGPLALVIASIGKKPSPKPAGQT
jgi:hypothetical protein